MPGLKEIIKKKNDRLSIVPLAFEKKVIQAQKDTFDEIISLLDQLERKEGFISISTKNLLLVEEITDKTKAVVLGGEYVEAIKEFAGEFDQQAQINIEYFKKAFNFSETELQAQILASSKKTAVELLVSGVESDFVLPLKSVLNDAVASGSGYVDTVKAIRTFAEGSGKLEGKLLRYSKQIAHDTFAVSDASYSAAIADDLGGEWFYYSGGEIAGTRDFCKERDNRYFHKKEIQAWASLTWQGKAAGTNERTIFNYRGGYNCEHSILMVSLFLVPKLDIERNISNGNFMPSSFEKTELGL